MNSVWHVVKMQQSGKLYVYDKDAGLIGLYGLRKDVGCMTESQETLDTAAEITAGLEVGDEVVSVPESGLEAGTRVKARPTPAD